MPKAAAILQNEQGAVMILITVMLLVLITIISMSALKTANTEVLISGNEYVYQRNFFHAEGAAMEAVDLLVSEADPTNTFSNWISMDRDIVDDKTVFGWWEEDHETGSVTPAMSSITSDIASENISFTAVHQVIAGDSLDADKPTRHTFSIYGRGKSKGVSIIKIGYTKAY